MNLVELLDTLEQMYPDRLPSSLNEYRGEKEMLVAIGQQEVIRVIRKLIGKDKD